MRLWHKDLISKLPRQQLLGQHRECCALRGMGWGRKHKTVDYVFNYSFSKLYIYHIKIMQEMKNRGYMVAPEWGSHEYRGKKIGYDYSEFTYLKDVSNYKEHNESYLNECLDNLKNKGITL